ncbi:hypothetical protein [Paraburkholderia sp. MM6662-R1]|uniref:hypothetical protein n=1 Tax=Paraburkholderia sp. MM6662-R1 TaxID=2991066 RepID=UPI003D211005
MKNRRRITRSHQKIMAAAMFVGLHAVCANGETAKLSDADVDRAIKACSVGKNLDVHVDAGLDLLKKRILSGKAGYTQSEIPSVIGTPVEMDQSKLELFKTIQDCVIKIVYRPVTRHTEDSTWTTPSVPAEITEDQARKMHEKGKTTAAGFSNCFPPPTDWQGKSGWHFVPGSATPMPERHVCNNGYSNSGAQSIDKLTEDTICMTAGARTPDPDAIAHCTTSFHATVTIRRQSD